MRLSYFHDTCQGTEKKTTTVVSGETAKLQTPVGEASACYYAPLICEFDITLGRRRLAGFHIELKKGYLRTDFPEGALRGWPGPAATRRNLVGAEYFQEGILGSTDATFIRAEVIRAEVVNQA